MRSAGHVIIALAPRFPDETKAWCADLGVITDLTRIDNQSLNPVRDGVALLHLIGKVYKYRPDVVMGYTHKPALYGAFAAWIGRVPRVTMMVTGMGFGFEPGVGRLRSIIPRITRALFKIACAACHKVIFHNCDNRTYFLDTGLLKDRTKACVVGGSGVDLSHYVPLPLPDPKLPFTFLMVARIVRYKGVLEYAKAAEVLAERFPGTRFLLAGYWDANPLSYSVEEWAFIRNHLTYLGKSRDVRELFAEANVYVLPSYGEGMPRTILEAMATGRAIITTDTYGCRETVVEGANGFLVPIAEWEPLRDVMNRFLVDRRLAVRMQEKSLELVRTKFDVENVNKDMIAALGL
jgi:glycosyltransferase involved in cell wall biosynthesis